MELWPYGGKLIKKFTGPQPESGTQPDPEQSPEYKKMKDGAKKLHDSQLKLINVKAIFEQKHKKDEAAVEYALINPCLLYTSPSPRDS